MKKELCLVLKSSDQTYATLEEIKYLEGLLK